MLEVKCYNCAQKFKKTKRRINESTKFGWKQYCSNKCQFAIRLTGSEYTCQTCGQNIWRTPKELRESKTKRFFCDTSCAAIYNNRVRNEFT